MLSNTNVRKNLEEYLEKFGVKKVHIARLIGVSPNTIGLFLKGQRELSLANLEAIQEIMQERM